MTRVSGVISRRAAIWLGALAAVAIVSAVVLMTLKGKNRGSYGNDSYSYSAIGYRALYNAISRMKVPVIRARGNPAARVRSDQWYLLAEPYPEKADSERIARSVKTAMNRSGRVWLVLPKWIGIAPAGHKGWVGEIGPAPVAEVELLLTTVMRAMGDGRSYTQCVRRVPLSSVQLHAPLSKVKISLPKVAQVISRACTTLTPLVEAKEGILIAIGIDPDVLVVADPDLLNNAGLRRNVALFHQLMIKVVKSKGVVIDETVHGHSRAESFWSEIWAFPLVLFTIQLIGFLSVVIWAGLRRFGKPDTLAAELGKGKETLIDNTSRLLEQGNYEGHALRRYLDLVVRDVARHHGIAADVETLAKIAAARNIPENLAAIAASVARMPERVRDSRKTRAIAMRLYRWRAAMVNYGSQQQKQAGKGRRGSAQQ